MIEFKSSMQNIVRYINQYHRVHKIAGGRTPSFHVELCEGRNNGQTTLALQKGLLAQ